MVTIDPPRDRFTRNYLIFLGVLGSLLLAWWLPTLDPRVWDLNDQLATDPELAAYSYTFRVQSIDNGVARVYSPRSTRIPALRFLAIVEPRLRGRDANDPQIIAAQHKLGKVQGRAREIILSHPGVSRLVWVEDIDWHARRGIVIP
jgi:hypothetical protein